MGFFFFFFFFFFFLILYRFWAIKLLKSVLDLFDVIIFKNPFVSILSYDIYYIVRKFCMLHACKAVFVLGENHFRKCFSGNEAVWLVRKILFSGN